MTGAKHQSVDLVFEGGGVKGIGLAGSLAILEERGFIPQNVAGTSAGAITAALLAAGYRGQELRDIVMDLDFRQFQDRAWEDKVPLIERSLSLLLDLGVYEGERFHTWMKERLAEKNVHTFADLVRDGEEDPRWRYDLQVVVSDVTKHELLVLPRDAGRLGVKPDELEVALAVRMSMSIPIFFEPVRQRTPRPARRTSSSTAECCPTTRYGCSTTTAPIRPSGRRSGCCWSSRSRRCRSEPGCPRRNRSTKAHAGSSRT